MIRDSLGLFSDAQALAYTSGAAGQQITQSTNWMEMSEHTDRLGIVTYPDLGPGQQLYVHFRVITGFVNATDALATFQALVYLDSTDPPNSASGVASYVPVSHPVQNTLTAGFTFNLAAGNSFVLPIASPQGAAVNPEAPLTSRGLGKRFIRVAYIIAHGAAATTTGTIEAILSTSSSVVGNSQGGAGQSKYVDGIYPANVDFGYS